MSLLGTLSNNWLPKIPDGAEGTIAVFSSTDPVALSSKDIAYGVMSNIAPSWWQDLVLYHNTGNESHLEHLAKYPPDGKMAAVFFPELLLSANQQMSFEEIVSPVFDVFGGTVIARTNSPLIVQCCDISPAPRRCWFMGGEYTNGRG